MRYKEQSLNNIERINNMLKNLEHNINFNAPRNETLETLELIRERLDNLRSLISIEQDTY
jgi:hypothetical protein